MLGSCDFYGLVVVVFVTLYWKSYRLEFNFIIMVQNICWYANFWLMQFGYRSQDRLIWIYFLLSLYGRYLVIVSSNTIDTANMCRLLQPIHFLSYPLYFFPLFFPSLRLSHVFLNWCRPWECFGRAGLKNVERGAGLWRAWEGHSSWELFWEGPKAIF